MSARTSTSSKFTTSSTSGPEPSPRHVSSVCVPKGKWYDSLRPTTTPYQGFGSMANFASMSGKDTQADAGENWTRDVCEKMR